MTKKLTIAVDLDDVLAASAQGFADFSNKRWGTKLTVDNYDENWSRMWGVDQIETEKRAKIVYAQRTTRKFVKFADAEAVLKLLAKKYKLVITTSRARFSEKDTVDWIDYHFKGVFSEIHFAGIWDRLEKDRHKLTKADLCKSVGASYLIDDHPKHCFAAAKAGITALMFGDYSWNRYSNKLPPNIIRVRNWPDIANYFNLNGKK